MCFRYKVYPFFDDRSESVRWGVGLFESAEGTFQYEEEDQDEDYTQSYKPHRHRRQSHGRGVRRRYEKYVPFQHRSDDEEVLMTNIIVIMKKIDRRSTKIDMEDNTRKGGGMKDDRWQKSQEGITTYRRKER